MDLLGEPLTVGMPELPVNGRTTYGGHHFVHGRLLSDSPMRHHPLTPMTNPDLVAWLGMQTRRRVGLTPYAVVEGGPSAIAKHWSGTASAGVEISILDCLNDRHAADLCEAACELTVIRRFRVRDPSARGLAVARLDRRGSLRSTRGVDGQPWLRGAGGGGQLLGGDSGAECLACGTRG